MPDSPFEPAHTHSKLAIDSFVSAFWSLERFQYAFGQRTVKLRLREWTLASGANR